MLAHTPPSVPRTAAHVRCGAKLAARGSYDVAVAGLDATPGVVRDLEVLLSEEERRRARRFAFDRDRRRFTLARATLRQLLGARLRVAPEEVEFAYGENGKPRLGGCGAVAALRFNVSHSEDVAVYAFAHGRDIGVDVEAVRPLRDAEDIAARFFSRSEVAAYRALDAGERPQGFFNCWTRKEAFVKALGDGLSHPLDRFDVSLAPGEPARLLQVDGRPGDACGWMVESFVPRPGFVAAVVLQTSCDVRPVAEKPAVAAASVN